MGDEPEVWISDDSGTGPAPQQGPGRGSGHGRWIALLAGFAALLALIAVQHFAGGTRTDDTAPTPNVSVTPPRTSSGTTTSSTPTSASTTDTSPATDEPSLSRPPPLVATALPTPTAPVTVTTRNDPPLADSDWELVGFYWPGAVGSDDAAIVRYRPAAGKLVTTPVPPLMSNGPLSFVATDDATVIRPMDGVPGYVIPDGQPAEIAGGVLAQGSMVIPAPQPDRMWVSAPDVDHMTLMMVDSTGRPTGPTITPPESLGIQGGWGLARDGDGAVLATAVGGVYDLRPGEARLVTHGAVLAAGPTGYLVYECNESAQCSTAVVDRATGAHTALDGYTPSVSAGLAQSQGVISPDGRHAAVLNYAAGPQVVLIDLHTGASAIVNDSPNSQAPTWGDAASLFAFTPDSSTLLLAAAGGVDVVDPATGTVRGQLPVPTLAAIAIRAVEYVE